MKTKYIARHNGVVVGKRTSDRTYTHAIVVQRIEERARKLAYEYEITESDKNNFAYYAEIVRQDVDHEHVKASVGRTTQFETLRGAKEHVAGGFTAYIERQRVDAIERFETALREGQFKPYVAGWAGRRDLAEKAVAQHTGPGTKFIAIVDAQTK